MLDTTDEVLDIQRNIFNDKTSQERFKIGNETINFGRLLVENSIKQQNINISEIDLKIQVFRRYYQDIFEDKELELIILTMKNYFENK
jgi:hypothetical protein